MDTRPETPDTDPAETSNDGAADGAEDGSAVGTDGGEPSVGFWKRMFGGGKEDGDEPEASAPTKATPAKRRNPNAPRKRSKTIFDTAEEQQRRRYAKAALARRERLAQAIGERVETALDERFESGEERLAEVAGVFEEMNGLLGAIGRNLDDQGGRAERMAQNLERLPQAAEEERVVLESIAQRLEGQAASVEGVPEVVALVRHGSKVAEERLFALQGLRHEMESQREQGKQMLDVLRKSSQAFTERMSALEEAIVKGQVEARSDARELRATLERNTESLQEESHRETQRSAHMLEGLRAVTGRLVEGNAVAAAAARSQDKALAGYRDAHEEMVDMLVRSQNRTLSEMHKLEEESQQRAEELARRSRLTLVGSAGFLAIIGAAFIGWASPHQPDPSPVYVPVATTPAAPAAKDDDRQPRTLPAGMPRTDAGE